MSPTATIEPELLKLLCCPETHQNLSLADAGVIERLNQQVAAGQLSNRGGKLVTEKLEGGLVRQDGRFLYPVREHIPVMLLDEAIPLPG